jgi:hypothetical protein
MCAAVVLPVRPKKVRSRSKEFVVSSKTTVAKPPPDVLTGGFSLAPRSVVDRTVVAA